MTKSVLLAWDSWKDMGKGKAVLKKHIPLLSLYVVGCFILLGYLGVIHSH